MPQHKDSADEAVEVTLEQHETWQDLAEWLRYPGKDDDVEGFVWATAERFKAVRRAPSNMAPRAPQIELDTLVDGLIAHYKVPADAVEEARVELTAHIARSDLDFVEQ